ncbi:MAG: CapA family protein [Prevotella sp.]|nr:CapA family protein [Prevotella sp.]
MQLLKNNIRLFFAGDFCSKPTTTPIKVSDELKDLIQSCDFKVVNFEVPLKPENNNLPSQKHERFYQHDDTPDFLRSLGFNLFQMANNHTFDWGEEGYLKTKAVLGDDAFGAGTYDEAYKVKVIEKDGVRIGFMALSFAAYTGVFDDVMNRDGLGCAYIHDLKVNHIIIEAKKDVDFLFVLPHDGIEYIDIPMPETIARYRDFIDYGADGVIGTHPHCPQGWEEYKGKPIFYSLGNFLFNSKDGYDYRAWNRPHWYEGLCVVMTIDKKKLSWEVVNTRNVDNLGIEIDHEDARKKHNEIICQYISNKDYYNRFLKNICKELGSKELSIVDKTFHSTTLKQCTRRILKNWYIKMTGKDFTNDFPLQRLLTHDARRNLLLWTLKMKRKDA